jgi:hypothetical protein
MAEEETGQEIAAPTVKGDNNTGVTDDMLNRAAMDAVAGQQETEPEAQEEEIVEQEQDVSRETSEEQEELDDEGLPVDHVKRSDLGRKVSAMHRRQDDVDSRLDKILKALEAQTNLATTKDSPDPLDALDPDEPMTKAEIDRYLEARERKAQEQTSYYDKTYLNTFNQLSATLSEAEAEAIVEEMKVMSYNPTKDPEKDAEVNFLKAERAYLRKQLAKPKGKVSPITGDKVKSPIGTVTSQKTVAKDVNLPKLDAAGASYLAFVEREDGIDRANELHRSLGKG